MKGGKKDSGLRTKRAGHFLAVLSAESFILMLIYLPAGCQTASPPRPVVTGTRDAADRAAAYCKQHNLNWGEPVYIIQQMDGYYVEFVFENGYRNVTHGLTVGYDGRVEE
jgi:hypothetical protein